MTRDQEWIRKHFEELVDNYGGKWIAVAKEELFVGETTKEVNEKVRKKYSDIIPSVLIVPTKEEIECHIL